MITVHNHSRNEIIISVGENFVSISLFYLNTESTYVNTNESGQITLIQDLGIHLQPNEMRFLKDEWRSNPNKLKYKMIAEQSYKLFADKRKKEINDKKKLSKQ